MIDNFNFATGRVGSASSNAIHSAARADTDPELELQPPEHLDVFDYLFLGIVFGLCALVLAAHSLCTWPRLARWWQWRRECSWCKQRMGGNPWARQTTHGLCSACAITLRDDVERQRDGFHPCVPSVPSVPISSDGQNLKPITSAEPPVAVRPAGAGKF